jgi:hypothetical protein
MTFKKPIRIPVYHFSEDQLELEKMGVKTSNEGYIVQDMYFYEISVVSEDQPGSEDSSTLIISSGESFYSPVPMYSVIMAIDEAINGPSDNHDIDI